MLAQKVALREVNAHSIVNATTRFTFAGKLVVKEAALGLGGIAPYPWRPARTEAAMAGQPLTLGGRFGALAEILGEEVARRAARAGRSGWPRRRTKGFTAEYRIAARRVRSSTRRSSTRWSQAGAKVPPDGPVERRDHVGPLAGRATGRQQYETQAFKAPVAQPYIKSTAMYQTVGAAPLHARAAPCRRSPPTAPSCRAAARWPTTTS